MYVYLSYGNLVSVVICSVKQVTPARDEDRCLEEPEEDEDDEQNCDLNYQLSFASVSSKRNAF